MIIWKLLLYLIASFILNVILERIEKKTNNQFLNYIIFSNFYMIVFAEFLNHCHLVDNNDSIFLVVLFQVLESLFYKTMVREQSFYKNNLDVFYKYGITLLTAYLLNIYFIDQVDSVFLNAEQFKIFLWQFFFIYIYFFLKENIKIKPKAISSIKFYQDREYIVMQYAKFKERYFKVVISKYPELEMLIYSMMIYENYHRPELLRKWDNLKYQIFHQRGKFGIMQIKRNYPIHDEKSIQLAIKRLEMIYQKLSLIEKDKLISNLIYHYYHQNIKEIVIIYVCIMKFESKIK